MKIYCAPDVIRKSQSSTAAVIMGYTVIKNYGYVMNVKVINAIYVFKLYVVILHAGREFVWNVYLPVRPVKTNSVKNIKRYVMVVLKKAVQNVSEKVIWKISYIAKIVLSNAVTVIKQPGRKAQNCADYAITPYV